MLLLVSVCLSRSLVPQPSKHEGLIYIHTCGRLGLAEERKVTHGLVIRETLRPETRDAPMGHVPLSPPPQPTAQFGRYAPRRAGISELPLEWLEAISLDASHSSSPFPMTLKECCKTEDSGHWPGCGTSGAWMQNFALSSTEGGRRPGSPREAGPFPLFPRVPRLHFLPLSEQQNR